MERGRQQSDSLANGYVHLSEEAEDRPDRLLLRGRADGGEKVSGSLGPELRRAVVKQRQRKRAVQLRLEPPH